MKTIILTAALCCAFISTAAIAQTADAPSTPAEEKVAKSTNELAFTAIQLMNDIYNTAATSNSKENALKAVAQIEMNFKHLDTLAIALKAAKTPTKTERAAFADNMVMMEKKFSTSIANLTKQLTSGNKEAVSIITPVLDKMTPKTSAISAALTLHYPAKTMEKYMTEARLRATSKKSKK